MVLPNEEVLGIVTTGASSIAKAFWTASCVREPLSNAPDIAYMHDVAVNNNNIVDGYMAVNSTRIYNHETGDPVLPIQHGYTILRTNTDALLFSRASTQVKSVFASHIIVDLNRYQLAMPHIELFNTVLNKSIRVQFTDTPYVLVSIFGVEQPFELPPELIAMNSGFVFTTQKLLLVVDTKLLSLPPIQAGNTASYRVTVRIVYNNTDYEMFSTNVNIDPTKRFVFEARQATLS
jgi:hypothetical protein